MTRFIANNIWKTIGKTARTAVRRRAAIAYVTRRPPLHLAAGDILITDASKQSIASGQTSARVLHELVDEGVLVYSRPGLHAKIAVLDDAVVASSANLSDASVNDGLVEAGVITTHPGTVAGALSFIDQLRRLSQKLTASQIRQLEEIPVVRNGGRPGNTSKRLPRVAAQSACWITGIYDLTVPLTESDEAEYDAGVAEATERALDPDADIYGVRYGKKQAFFLNVREGDTVIRLWRSRSKVTRPTLVFPPSAVLRRKEGKRFGWVFYANPSVKHEGLKWGEFQKLCKRVGVPFALTKDMNRRVPDEFAEAIYDLWSKASAR